jgi:hypothetical protein
MQAAGYDQQHSTGSMAGPRGCKNRRPALSGVEGTGHPKFRNGNSRPIANQMRAPNQPGSRRGCDGARFEIEPQRAPDPMWLLESADRSRVGAGGCSARL